MHITSKKAYFQRYSGEYSARIQALHFGNDCINFSVLFRGDDTSIQHTLNNRHGCSIGDNTLAQFHIHLPTPLLRNSAKHLREQYWLFARWEWKVSPQLWQICAYTFLRTIWSGCAFHHAIRHWSQQNRFFFLWGVCTNSLPQCAHTVSYCGRGCLRQ